MKIKKLLALLLALAMVLTSMPLALAEEVAPVVEAPAVEEPAEEQPAEEQPAEEQPAEEQPAEEQPVEEQPVEEQPAEEVPAAPVVAEESSAEEAALPAVNEVAEAEAEEQNADIPAANEHENERFTVTFDCGEGDFVTRPSDVIPVPGESGLYTQGNIPWQGKIGPESDYKAELEGHSFAGWYIDSAFKTEFKFNQTEITSDITIYAKYDIYKANAFYTVNAENNNYTLEYNQKEFSYGDLLTVPVITSDEWKLVSWSPAEDSEVKPTEPYGEISVVATVERKSYNVYVDVNDGETEPALDVNSPYVYDAEYTAPNAPELDGKIFTGWEVNGTTQIIQPGDKINIKKETTLKAQWKGITYPVQFKDETGKELADEVKVPDGEKLIAPEIEIPDEKELDHWIVSDGGDYKYPTRTFSFDWIFGEAVTLNQGVEPTNIKPLVLSPVFKDKTYRVTFLGYNDEEFAVVDVRYGYEIGSYIPSREPTRVGYTFKYWKTEDGLELKPRMKVYSNMTVNAEWEQRVYKLQLVTGNGHSSITKYADGTTFESQIRAYHGDTITLKDLPKDNGQTFVRWYYEDDADGNHDITEDEKITVTEWTIGTTGVDDPEQDVPPTPGRSDWYVYAEWADFYTVTFEAGEVTEIVEVPVTRDEEGTETTVVLLPEDMKDIVFPDDVFFSGKWLIKGTEQDVTTALTGDTGYAVRDNITIHADLHDMQTIVFDPTPGELEEGASAYIVVPEGYSYNQYLEAIDVETEETPQAERKGYGFGGWFTGTDGGGKYFDYYTVINDDSYATVYAQWLPMGWTATFDPNGGTLTGGDHQDLHSGDHVTEPTDPVREGWIFEGWFLLDEEGKPAEEEFDFENYEILSNITLQAQWQEAEAKIGDVLYPTLADAAKAAVDGDVVEPIKDIVLYDPIDGPVFTVDATLDLGTFTISTAYDDVAIQSTAGTLTITNKNGTIDGVGVTASGSGAVVIESGDFIDVVFTGKVTVNGGRFEVVPTTFSEGALINGGEYYIDTLPTSDRWRLTWFDKYLKQDEDQKYMLFMSERLVPIDPGTVYGPYTLVPYHTITLHWMDDTLATNVFDIPDTYSPYIFMQDYYAAMIAFAKAHPEWVASHYFNTEKDLYLEETYVSHVNPSKKLLEDADWYVKWSNTFNVKFTDGNLLVASVKYVEGDKIDSDDFIIHTDEGEKPINEVYIGRTDQEPSDIRLFDYWTLDGEQITYTEIEKIKVTEDIEFVAVNDVEVVYDADGGYFDNDQAKRTYKEYIPYNTEANNYSENTIQHQVIKPHFEFANWYQVIDDVRAETPWVFFTKVTEDIKLIATWKHNIESWDINKVLTDFADSKDMHRYTIDINHDGVRFGETGEWVEIHKFDKVVEGQLPDKPGYYVAVQVMAPSDIEIVDPTDTENLWRVKVGGKWYDFNTLDGKADDSYYGEQGYLVMNIYEQISPDDLKTAAKNKTAVNFTYIFAKAGDEAKAVQPGGYNKAYYVDVFVHPQNLVFLDGESSTYRFVDWQYGFEVTFDDQFFVKRGTEYVTGKNVTNTSDHGYNPGYVELVKVYESGTSFADLKQPVPDPDWTVIKSGSTTTLEGGIFTGWNYTSTLTGTKTTDAKIAKFDGSEIIESTTTFSANFKEANLVVFWNDDPTKYLDTYYKEDPKNGPVLHFEKFEKASTTAPSYSAITLVPNMPEKRPVAGGTTTVFGGWVTDEEYKASYTQWAKGEETIPAIDFSTDTRKITDDVEFVPVYTPIGKVTFWKNETEQFGEVQEFGIGTSEKEIEQPNGKELTPPEDDKIFGGWAVRAEDGSAIPLNPPTTRTGVGYPFTSRIGGNAYYTDGNIDFVPNWVDKVTVQFFDGGEIKYSQDLYKVVSTVEDIKVPEDMGKGFLYWALATDPKLEKYSFRANKAKLINDDMVFVAVRENQYNIIFFDEDEETVIDTKTASPTTTLEEIYVEPEESEIKEFLGWFLMDEDGNIADKPTVFDDTKITSNMTFVAQYEVLHYVWFEPSLSLNEAIGMRVYIHLPEDDDPMDYTVTKEYHSKYQDVTGEEVVGELDWNYGWLFKITENASDEMSDEATVTVYYKGEQVAQRVYSIRSIADEWLAQNKHVDILNAMLQYGAKAQVQFGNKPDDLPEPPNPPALVAIPDTYAVSGDPTTMDDYITMDTGLNLVSRVSMRFYFKPAEGLGADDFTFVVKDQDGRGAVYSKPVMQGDEILLEVTNINPHQMSNQYSITVTLKSDTSKTATWKRSVMNNAYKLQQKGVALDLLKAMYQYHLAAKKQFGN